MSVRVLMFLLCGWCNIVVVCGGRRRVGRGLRRRVGRTEGGIEGSEVEVALGEFLALVIVFSVVVNLLLLEKGCNPLGVGSASLAFLNVSFRGPCDPVCEVAVGSRTADFECVGSGGCPLVPCFMCFRGVSSDGSSIGGAVGCGSGVVLSVDTALYEDGSTGNGCISTYCCSRPVCRGIGVGVRDVGVADGGGVVCGNVFGGGLDACVGGDNVCGVRMMSGCGGIGAALVFSIRIV